MKLHKKAIILILAQIVLTLGASSAYASSPPCHSSRLSDPPLTVGLGYALSALPALLSSSGKVELQLGGGLAHEAETWPGSSSETHKAIELSSRTHLPLWDSPVAFDTFWHTAFGGSDGCLGQEVQSRAMLGLSHTWRLDGMEYRLGLAGAYERYATPGGHSFAREHFAGAPYAEVGYNVVPDHRTWLRAFYLLRVPNYGGEPIQGYRAELGHTVAVSRAVGYSLSLRAEGSDWDTPDVRPGYFHRTTVMGLGGVEF